MYHHLQQWNRKASKWLWLLTIIGVLAALPLGIQRYHMEQTSNHVEFVFDYRDLLQVAAYQAKPQDYVQQQLILMKEAGIGTMAVFESTLEELSWAGRITLYNSSQAATLRGEPAPLNENYAYLLFADEATQQGLSPMIEASFEYFGISVAPYSYGGRTGLRLETPVENAIVKPMPPDPLAMKSLREQGFHLLPRLSDRMLPFDAQQTDRMLADFKALGVTRILFDGTAVKGHADHAEQQSLQVFGQLLKDYGMGVAAIENLKVPQLGMNTLAYATDYNVARIYSLSEADSMAVSPVVLADRFLLAAKDRNIRMFYLNGQVLRSVDKAGIIDSLDNVYQSLQGNDDTAGAVALLQNYGFENGPAVAFQSDNPGWVKPLKAVVSAGAVALIALLIGAFIPVLLLPSFLIGLIGSAGLYVLSTSLLEQALALGAAISTPTLALIWVIGRIRLHTDGDRRAVGGEWANGKPANEGLLFGGQWVFTGLSASRRLTMAIGLFIATAVISLVSVPYVFGLLNDITYSLVLQQFRGVSLLHLAPIALVALYLFLYTGTSPLDNLRKLLRLQITVLWVLVAGVLGVVGMYYMSRTGNAGQVSNIELLFRNIMETTIGVRPRLKEFLFAHPLFLFGIFLALKYRAAWVLIIVASIGQLSMVDTFAHIHTPLMISLIRVLLGLGIGAVIGLVLIAAWQIGEGVWRRWVPKLGNKSSA